MKGLDNILIGAKWIAAGLITIWANLSATVQLLVMLMALDYFSGVLVALLRRQLSSEAGFVGLIKKILVLVLVWATHLFSFRMQIPYDLGTYIAVFFCINEMISITENCAYVGVPIPAALIKYLQKAKKLGAYEGAEKREGRDPAWQGLDRRKAPGRIIEKWYKHK